jgi:hypothetical protein
MKNLMKQMVVGTAVVMTLAAGETVASAKEKGVCGTGLPFFPTVESRLHDLVEFVSVARTNDVLRQFDVDFMFDLPWPRDQSRVDRHFAGWTGFVDDLLGPQDLTLRIRDDRQLDFVHLHVR